MGENSKIVNVSLYIVKKDYSCLFAHREKGLFLSVFVDDIKLAGKKLLIRCGNYSIKKSIWENQHLSWTVYTWDALKENAK